VLCAIKRGVAMFAGDDTQRAPALLEELSRMCANSKDLRERRRASMEQRAPVFR